ncbi:MAG TPA: branched-chain amino acid transport system II carrier protein [Myxococcota bacterium]|nr:branched-chain amino acid transport system II carrier protein [Myxococcota bacterium]
MSTNKPSYFVVGLALFSMFFGSGNLIFPLMLGRDAGAAFAISAFGFVLTAVIVPAFGILAITFAEGNYERIFQKTFPRRISLALIFIVLLSFIPFGAGPRCVVLAHASLKTFMPMPSLWLFSALFLGLVGYLVSDRAHLLDVLGKILTPLLLVSIAIMVLSSFLHGEIDPPTKSNLALFTESLFEGYNTQDLLSSLFFSSSLIMLLKANFSSRKAMIITVLKGSLVGIILLAGLYVLLIAASSLHSDVLIGHSGIDLVSILARHTLGKEFGLVAGIAVALACLTTAVALIMAFAQFLATHLLTGDYQKYALPISLISVFFTALLEFDGIMAIISPMMKVVYPVILFVVCRYLIDLWLQYRDKGSSLLTRKN